MAELTFITDVIIKIGMPFVTFGSYIIAKKIITRATRDKDLSKKKMNLLDAVPLFISIVLLFAWVVVTSIISANLIMADPQLSEEYTVMINSTANSL